MLELPILKSLRLMEKAPRNQYPPVNVSNLKGISISRVSVIKGKLVPG
jgi:hypothetical protein